MPQLSPTALHNVLFFLGYGDPAARLWFVGLEEGLGKMEGNDVSANLEARGRFKATMDLCEAHLTLVEGGRPYDLSVRSDITQVWIWLAKLARAVEGAPDWTNLEAAKHYVRTRLGRSDGSTFMTYASPVPEANLKSRPWTYALLGTESVPQDALMRRRARIAALVRQHRPAVIICHGKESWPEYEAMLPELAWSDLIGEPRIRTATSEAGEQFFLMPFLGNGMSHVLASALVGAIRCSDPPTLPSLKAAPADGRHERPPALKPDELSLGQLLRDGDPGSPKQTAALLGGLTRLGFSDLAFSRLHHRRTGTSETIRGFLAYCDRTNAFRRDDNNWRVHRRLALVAEGYIADHAVDFVLEATKAYARIPPIHAGPRVGAGAGKAKE